MTDDRSYLRHIIDAVDRITEYTKGGESEFYSNLMVQDAVIRNIQVIGEPCKRLTSKLRSKHPDIPWREIAGMRDVVTHDYFGIKPAIVRETVERDLSLMRTRAESIMQSSEDDF